MAIKDQAKYLGLILGPGAGDDSWTAPLAKMLDRAQLWGALGPGVFHTCAAFQVFVASVVMFVAQLRPLPATFSAAETKACSKLFPGPREWASAEFLIQLRDLGFPCELMDIRCASIAAKARVCHYEDAQQGGLRVRRRARQLRHRMHCTLRELLPASIERWLESNTLFVLEAAEERVHELELAQNLPCTRTATQEARQQMKTTWQAERNKALLAGRPRAPVDVFMRRRLDHWDIDVVPGARVQRFRSRMEAVSAFVPPCVLAAALRTAFNGWVTTRRFQQNGRCAFGCARGVDSINHYAHCSYYHRWSEEHCGLSRPTASQCLPNFLGLCASASSARAGAARTQQELDALRAVCRYALYRAHLAIRHRAVEAADAGAVFKAAVRDACSAEPLDSLLARARSRPRALTSAGERRAVSRRPS